MECPVRRCYKLLRNTKHTLAESEKSHISLTILPKISLNDCDGFVDQCWSWDDYTTLWSPTWHSVVCQDGNPENISSIVEFSNKMQLKQECPLWVMKYDIESAQRVPLCMYCFSYRIGKQRDPKIPSSILRTNESSAPFSSPFHSSHGYCMYSLFGCSTCGAWLLLCCSKARNLFTHRLTNILIKQNIPIELMYIMR